MKMDTYIIANGGCGERLASVMLALYQCGFYENRNNDDEITDPIKGILIVDNDLSNRALVKCEDIVNGINSMNRFVERNYPQIKCVKWAPMVTGREQLNSFKGDNEKRALDLIATDAERNHGINGIGYAGHVNIGVTVVNSALETEENQKIFNTFLDSAANREGGGEARFIIIGSTHGGTGAALNTAIAKKIRDYYGQHDPARIKIYGLFMLSYYSIKPADGEEDGIDIDPNQFRPSDIEALEAYRGMDLVNGTFENILLCGFDPRNPTSLKHTTGGNNQNNRFSLPELLMCAGAYFMFDPENKVFPNKFLGVNLQDTFDGTIHWNNVPYGERLKKCIEKMALFACSMSEGTKVLGGWSIYLTERFHWRFYMDKNSEDKERPGFNAQRDGILIFLNKLWNMLYQISTNVNGDWDKFTVLFKESVLTCHITEEDSTQESDAPETISIPDGFGWISKFTSADCSVINYGDGNKQFPTMSNIGSKFKRYLGSNARSLTPPPDDDEEAKKLYYEIRKKLYFTSLFEAIYDL